MLIRNRGNAIYFHDDPECQIPSHSMGLPQMYKPAYIGDHWGGCWGSLGGFLFSGSHLFHMSSSRTDSGTADPRSTQSVAVLRLCSARAESLWQTLDSSQSQARARQTSVDVLGLGADCGRQWRTSVVGGGFEGFSLAIDRNFGFADGVMFLLLTIC